MTQVIVQKLSDNDSAKAGVLQVTARCCGELPRCRHCLCCGNSHSFDWHRSVTRTLCGLQVASVASSATVVGCPHLDRHPASPHHMHLQYADHIMDALLNVFACRKSSVHEEAMLAVVSWPAGGCHTRR